MGLRGNMRRKQAYKDVISLIEMAYNARLDTIVSKQDDTFLIKTRDVSSGKTVNIEAKIRSNSKNVRPLIDSPKNYIIHCSGSMIKIFNKKNQKKIFTIFVNKNNSEFYVEDKGKKVTKFPIYGLRASKINKNVQYRDPLYRIQYSHDRLMISVPFLVQVGKGMKSMEIANLIVNIPSNKLYYYLITLPEYRFLAYGKNWLADLDDVLYFNAFDSVFFIGKTVFVPGSTRHGIKKVKSYSNSLSGHMELFPSKHANPIYYFYQYDPESKHLAVIYINNALDACLDVYDTVNSKAVISQKILYSVKDSRRFYYTSKTPDGRIIASLVYLPDTKQSILYVINVNSAKVKRMELSQLYDMKKTGGLSLYSSPQNKSITIAYSYKKPPYKILFIIDHDTFYDFRNKELLLDSIKSFPFFYVPMTVSYVSKLGNEENIERER